MPPERPSELTGASQANHQFGEEGVLCRQGFHLPGKRCGLEQVVLGRAGAP